MMRTAMPSTADGMRRSQELESVCRVFPIEASLRICLKPEAVCESLQDGVRFSEWLSSRLSVVRTSPIVRVVAESGSTLEGC